MIRRILTVPLKAIALRVKSLEWKIICAALYGMVDIYGPLPAIAMILRAAYSNHKKENRHARTEKGNLPRL